MAVLMFVDGVLRSHTGSPIYQGLALYRLFNDSNRVVLLCEHRAKDDRWLREHKINKLDDLIDRSIPSMTDFPEWRQVEYCRGQGAIDMVVTSNPELAKKLLEVGLQPWSLCNLLTLRRSFAQTAVRGARLGARFRLRFACNRIQS